VHRHPLHRRHVAERHRLVEQAQHVGAAGFARRPVGVVRGAGVPGAEPRGFGQGAVAGGEVQVGEGEKVRAERAGVGLLQARESEWAGDEEA